MSPWQIEINNPHMTEDSVVVVEGGYGLALPEIGDGGEPHLIITAGTSRGQSVLRIGESPGPELQSRIMQLVQYDEVFDDDSPKTFQGYHIWGLIRAVYLP